MAGSGRGAAEPSRSIEPARTSSVNGPAPASLVVAWVRREREAPIAGWPPGYNATARAAALQARANSANCAAVSGGRGGGADSATATRTGGTGARLGSQGGSGTNRESSGETGVLSHGTGRQR